MDLEDNGDLTEAEKKWTAVIENFEARPEWRLEGTSFNSLLARAYASRASCRVSLNRSREGILDFSEALKIEPTNASYWLGRGLAFEAFGDQKCIYDGDQNVAAIFYQSALSDYDHASVLNPNNARYQAQRGDIFNALGRSIECGNLDGGTALIQSILKSYPDSPDMLLVGAALAWEYGSLAEVCTDVPYVFFLAPRKDDSLTLPPSSPVKSVAMYQMAITLDDRLLDDRYILYALRWPAVPVNMEKTLRAAEGNQSLEGVSNLHGPIHLRMELCVIIGTICE